MEGSAAVAAASFASGLQHASQLVPMLQRVIREAGWGELSTAGVEALYVSVGPGSFTGLRVAVTLVKGLWLARQLAGGPPLGVVAVPTLRAIVENVPGEPGVEAAVVLDAKRGQVFTASYRWEGASTGVMNGERSPEHGGWREVRPARLDTLADVVAEARSRGVRLRLLGEGLRYHTPPEPAGADLLDEALWWPRAASVGRLGHAMAGRGQWAEAERLEPLYVRLPEAEEKWARQQPAGN